MERNGLISSDGDTICRVYSLTAKGKKALMNMLGESREIQELIIASILAKD